MKKAALAAILAVVVVAAATAAVFSEYGRGTAGSGATGMASSSLATHLPTNCTTTFPDGLALRGSGNETRLFTLLPGGTGLFCVTYSVDTGGMTQASDTIEFSSSVDIVHASYSVNPNGEGNVYSYSYLAAPGVKETADPSAVTFQRGSGSPTTVTVVYTIVASQNSSGFYSLGFTSCSPLIPLAITYNWQKVEASDFTGFFLPLDCTFQPPFSDARVTGLASMNTSLLVGQ